MATMPLTLYVYIYITYAVSNPNANHSLYVLASMILCMECYPRRAPDGRAAHNAGFLSCSTPEEGSLKFGV